MSDWYGINSPFSGGIQNVLSRQIGTRLIKNDILQLLFTNPGERVYRPDYGIGIRTYVFEQLDEISISTLRSNIRNQIKIYDSRVIIDQLDIIMNKDENMIKITMVLSLIQSPNEKFEVNLDLPIFEEATLNG